MKTELRKPCVECPFRKNHMPGWLGPWTAGDLVRHIHADGVFPCHRAIPKDSPETMNMDDPRVADLQTCAGASIHMNRAVKRSRNPDHAAHQEILKDAPKAITEKVFQWPQEFIDHHTQDLDQWIKKHKEPTR